MLRVEFGVFSNLSLVEDPTWLRLLQSRQPYHAKFEQPQDMREASRGDSAPSVHFTQPSHGEFLAMCCTKRQNVLSLPGI
jgi:hypothetical protein